MSNAGYGNHDASKPGAAVGTPVAPEPAIHKPEVAQGDVGPPPDTGGSTTPQGDRREVATPGDGAGPAGPQGRDVDPGVG